MSDSDSIKNLARSVASLSLLMVSSRYAVVGTSILSLDSCADASRWAALVTLLAGFYYLTFSVWRRCRRRRHRGAEAGADSGMVAAAGGCFEPRGQAAYTDVPQTPRRPRMGPTHRDSA